MPWKAARPSWPALVGRASLALFTLVTLAIAAAARRPPSETIVDLLFPLRDGAYYVAAGGWVMAVARALTAVPMHAFLGAIMGYYVGHSHLPPPVKHPAWLGFVAAVLLHGLYDFPLLTLHAVAASGDPLHHPAQALALLALLGFALAILIAAGVWTLLLVRRARREQLELAALMTPIPS